MPKYNYKARDGRGLEIQGRIEATSFSDGVQTLRSKGLDPVSFLEVPPVARAVVAVKAEDLEIFTHQMSSLADSGLPLVSSIEGLASSGSSEALRQVCSSLVEGLHAGSTLSSCMQHHPKVFDQYYLSMIEAAEATGTLAETFRRLTQHLEFQREMKTKTKAALRYPMTVAVVTLIALMVVNVFVIPAFAKAYESFGAELPFITLLLVSTSSFIVHYWFLVLGGGVLLAVATRAYLASEGGAIKWGRLKLKLPVIGKLMHQASLSRYCAALAGAYDSGIPIHNALELVSGTTGNPWLTQRLGLIREAIDQGQPLSKALEGSQAFTALVLQMVQVGEQTGRLGVQLMKVSSYYREGVERDLRTLSERIEPIMLVIMAVLVLILALGVFLPMWDMATLALHGLKK